MKRRLRAAVALGVAAVFVPIAAAQAQMLDTVAGSGNATACAGELQVNVQSGPSGENPSGRLVCGAFLNGFVTCVNVQRNVALLVFRDLTMGSVAMRVTDNGQSGDRVEYVGGSDCGHPQPTYSDLGFTGDIVVHDAFTQPQAKFICVAERGEIGRRAFRAKYGTPGHALRNCITLRRA